MRQCVLEFKKLTFSQLMRFHSSLQDYFHQQEDGTYIETPPEVHAAASIAVLCCFIVAPVASIVVLLLLLLFLCCWYCCFHCCGYFFCIVVDVAPIMYRVPLMLAVVRSKVVTASPW